MQTRKKPNNKVKNRHTPPVQAADRTSRRNKETYRRKKREKDTASINTRLATGKWAQGYLEEERNKQMGVRAPGKQSKKEGKKRGACTG